MKKVSATDKLSPREPLGELKTAYAAIRAPAGLAAAVASAAEKRSAPPARRHWPALALAASVMLIVIVAPVLRQSDPVDVHPVLSLPNLPGLARFELPSRSRIVGGIPTLGGLPVLPSAHAPRRPAPDTERRSERKPPRSRFT